VLKRGGSTCPKRDTRNDVFLVMFHQGSFAKSEWHRFPSSDAGVLSERQILIPSFRFSSWLEPSWVVGTATAFLYALTRFQSESASLNLFDPFQRHQQKLKLTQISFLHFRGHFDRGLYRKPACSPAPESDLERPPSNDQSPLDPARESSANQGC
jgi:hypothetical protein